MANVGHTPSLAHLLLLVSLAGSKGTVDGAHPLILLRYARRLQVIQLCQTPVSLSRVSPEISLMVRKLHMKFGVVLSEQPIFVENKSDIAAHMMNSVQ
jgi:hypothetical protein